jgi:hypothetical protein
VSNAKGSIFRVPPPGVHTPAQPAGAGSAPIDSQNASQNYEAFDRYFPIAVQAETSVYKTKKAWAGLDVFVNLPGYNYATGVGTQRFATIRIYAITRGNRSLVASGRVTVTKDMGKGAIWVAAARCDADQFEVTFEADLLQSPNLPGTQAPKLLVSCVASDRNTAIPDGLGEQVADFGSTGIPQSMFGLHTFTLTVPRMRITGVNAVNKIASPRILQFRTTGAVGNPFAAFGMPLQGSPIYAKAGNGLLDGVPRYDQIIVDVLQANGTAGADGDVQWQFWFD